ncbi:MAG: type II toxin-antitoxin system HicA family toxin [Armatimonadetes bacterium]|jgi:hypothetical protein|nr:type II toxin-antitoxin system HicA family toxin [Armatimonadota bacterium]
MGASDLPEASGREIVRCLCERFGFTYSRRGGRNHFILRREGRNPPVLVVIPDHRKVKRELLAAELTHAGIEHKAFAKAFRGK